MNRSQHGDREKIITYLICYLIRTLQEINLKKLNHTVNHHDIVIVDFLITIVT